jgi:ribosome maturation factor RimP
VKCRRGLYTESSFDAGWSSLVARRAHNPKVVGSNPAPATNTVLSATNGIDNTMFKKPLLGAFFVVGEYVAVKAQQLQEFLAPTVEALGFDLWGIEYVSQGRHSVLCIYIESDKGITVDNCAAVSHQLSSVLDVEDAITGEYTLEVSSPGMDRLLFKLEQYGAYIGEQIELRLRRPYEGRRKFKGLLKGIEGEDIVIQVDDHEYLLPHDAVEKARIQSRA